MSVLTVIQEAADRIGLARPSGVANASDVGTRQLVGLLKKEGEVLRSDYNWSELLREHSLTLVADQSSYALPGDFLRMANRTFYDENNYWPLTGPINPELWTIQTKGLQSAEPYRQFRISGFADNELQVYGTPSASEAGYILSFQYYSKNWLRPKTWGTGETARAGDYRFYNGNFYVCVTGGTTGSTAPTHITGTVTDGGATWTYTTEAYESITNNADQPILPEDVLKLGVEWRFRRSKNLDYVDQKMEYDMMVKTRSTSIKGAPVLSLNSRRVATLIPETGFGGI